jgi:hypothetical protein
MYITAEGEIFELSKNIFWGDILWPSPAQRALFEVNQALSNVTNGLVDLAVLS